MSHTFDVHYAKYLKDETGMTIQQIAEISRVPQGTVSHIMNGETQNPTFSNVADIIYALGGSLDDMTGKSKSANSECCESINAEYESIMQKALDSSRDSFNNAYANTKAVYEKERDMLTEMIHMKDIWIRRMFIYSCSVTAMIAIILIWRVSW